MTDDEKRHSILKSINGIIYFGLLHRELLKFDIGNELKDAKISESKQMKRHFDSMEKNKVIRVVERKQIDGKKNPIVIYTSEPRIIEDTINNLLYEILDIIRTTSDKNDPNEDPHEDEITLDAELDKIKSLLQLVAPLNKYFPQFVIKYCQSTREIENSDGNKGIRISNWTRVNDLSWTSILSIYLYFIQRTIHGARNVVDMCKDERPTKEELDLLLAKFQKQKNKRKWSAPLAREYLLMGIEGEIITYDDVIQLASYMKHEGELFNINSFSSHLMLLHVGLKDFHMGTNIASLYALISKEPIQVPLQKQLIKELKLPI